MVAKIIKDKAMSAEEVAANIQNGEVIGTSGFTSAGDPKVIPIALANRAKELHNRSQAFQVSVFTGASVSDRFDGELVRANAIKKRYPFQTNKSMRKAINEGEVEFVDFHLSHVAQQMRYGFIDRCNTAIVEASDITDDGKIYLTMSGGMSATYLMMASRVFIELNRNYDGFIKSLHDVYVPNEPPHRAPIPIYHPSDKIGTPYIHVDPAKIIGIVETELPGRDTVFKESDHVSDRIAEHLVEFFKLERRVGRMPQHLPFQLGVGNVSNAVLSKMAKCQDMDQISMYTEVVQDSVFDLIDSDKLEFVSTCAMTLSSAGEKRFREQLADLKSRFVIRQQEVSNNPEIIRRLGVISINTALELDIFGNVNSTHVNGSYMMNGIGGSGDFCRNSYVSIFMAPSVAKGGSISTVVPMVTHVDHNEHSVHVVVTEQGLADLRGLSPVRRARKIIENCVHPDYKSLLEEYLDYGLKNAASKHTPHVLERAFEFHLRFQQTGTMKK